MKIIHLIVVFIFLISCSSRLKQPKKVYKSIKAAFSSPTNLTLKPGKYLSQQYKFNEYLDSISYKGHKMRFMVIDFEITKPKELRASLSGYSEAFGGKKLNGVKPLVYIKSLATGKMISIIKSKVIPAQDVDGVHFKLDIKTEFLKKGKYKMLIVADTRDKNEYPIEANIVVSGIPMTRLFVLVPSNEGYVFINMKDK